MSAFVCYLIQIKILFSVDHLKNQWKKVWDSYKRAIEKRVEQARSGAGSSKLVTCKHFNLLSFLQLTVTSQGTDSNVDTGFCENQNNIEPSNEISEDFQITTNSCSTINISNATETCQAKNKNIRKSKDTIEVQLRESLNNVNDAVKAITQNQNFVDKSNNDTDLDILFCRSLVNSLRGLTKRKNKIAYMKIKKVLFKVFIWVKFWVSVKMSSKGVTRRCSTNMQQKYKRIGM